MCDMASKSEGRYCLMKAMMPSVFAPLAVVEDLYQTSVRSESAIYTNIVSQQSNLLIRGADVQEEQERELGVAQPTPELGTLSSSPNAYS